jgi:hypothetical protein
VKNYLPENMGFPIHSSSFVDMVPDSLLICPATYSNGKSKQVGYRHRTCAACGKEFECTNEHRYKVLRNHKHKQRMLYYCSYSCYRPVEKKEEEIFRYRAFNCVREYDPSKDTAERAQARLKQCKKKLEEIKHEIFDDPAAFKALGASQRKNLKNKLAVWTEKLAYAEERVREVEGYEPEDE